MLSPFSSVILFVIQWIGTHQAPLSMEFSMQECWDELLPGASVRNPARDKVMRKEADIRKACSDFRDPSGNS